MVGSKVGICTFSEWVLCHIDMCQPEYACCVCHAACLYCAVLCAMQACNRMNYVCVPLYETLGDTAVEFILEHSEVSLVAIEGKRLQRLARALHQVPKLLAVVYWGAADPADLKVTGWKGGGQTSGA